MNPRPRVVIVFAVALGGVVGQRALSEQAPTWPRRELAQHLAAADLAEVAWAAHMAQLGQVREAVPAVRAALARLAGKDDSPSQLARLHLLDVLLQLDVRMPGEELLPHAVGALRVPTLLLAVKAPEVNEAFLKARMMARAGDEDTEWRVCGNLRASLRDPRFVCLCLEALDVPLRLTIKDGKAPGIGAG